MDAVNFGVCDVCITIILNMKRKHSQINYNNRNRKVVWPDAASKKVEVSVNVYPATSFEPDQHVAQRVLQVQDVYKYASSKTRVLCK